VSTIGAIPFRTQHTGGFGLHSTGLGLHSTGFGLHSTGFGLHGSGGGAGGLQDGLEQLSLIICESCATTTSSAIAYIVKAVKPNKTILFIVYFSYL
jgi:hypothetical protein